MQVVTTALAGAAAAGLGALAWGTLIERNRFTLRREVVPVLQPGARPITVLHFSDFHGQNRTGSAASPCTSRTSS
jgi:hypothetical protein